MEKTYKIIEDYFKLFPLDKKELENLNKFISEENDLFNRKNYN
jgi:hypothetical protein